MSRNKETWQAFYPTHSSIRYQGGNEMVTSIELDKFPDRTVELTLSVGDAIRLRDNLNAFIHFARMREIENGGLS